MSARQPRSPDTSLDSVPLDAIASRVGTPFYLYRADAVRASIAALRAAAPAPDFAVRYAMKACSARRVLEEIRSGAGRL